MLHIWRLDPSTKSGWMIGKIGEIVNLIKWGVATARRVGHLYGFHKEVNIIIFGFKTGFSNSVRNPLENGIKKWVRRAPNIF